jgi:hypothetical protein
MLLMAMVTNPMIPLIGMMVLVMMVTLMHSDQDNEDRSSDGEEDAEMRSGDEVV